MYVCICMYVCMYVPGMYVLNICPMHFVSLVEECKVCGSGRWQDQTNGRFPECKLCPSGYFISDAGKDDKKHQVQGDCLQCAPGQFSNPGAQYCLECSVGRRSTFNRTTNESSCIDCVAGTYQDTVGNATCKQCPRGTHQNVPARPFCLPCVPGRFQDQLNHAA